MLVTEVDTRRIVWKSADSSADVGPICLGCTLRGKCWQRRARLCRISESHDLEKSLCLGSDRLGGLGRVKSRGCKDLARGREPRRHVQSLMCTCDAEWSCRE